MPLRCSPNNYTNNSPADSAADCCADVLPKQSSRGGYEKDINDPVKQSGFARAQRQDQLRVLQTICDYQNSAWSIDSNLTESLYVGDVDPSTFWIIHDLLAEKRNLR
jgi:hypothetical protein